MSKKLQNDNLDRNKAGSGTRTAHDQMERNFSIDRNKARKKGESTTPPKKR